MHGSSGVNDEDCVELGRLAAGAGAGAGAGVGVRDSKDLDGGHLTLSVAEFAGLIKQIKRHPAR
ncbi:DUF397 domain-containing protein [Actinomadura bangladeshensis]|uniref:DUF397 domain-containing protein n=1 Tax=Actinomadura bangladeshensis TaxID=453573 RepID=A0A6L9QBC9_9ACTN|nr:DUF397 domain-containing protein [Actinomadura bangladeshensis]NEA22800.1 DUF397 domain-containing protein [Actinomadura bangladeshensis]